MENVPHYVLVWSHGVHFFATEMHTDVGLPMGSYGTNTVFSDGNSALLPMRIERPMGNPLGPPGGLSRVPTVHAILLLHGTHRTSKGTSHGYTAGP